MEILSLDPLKKLDLKSPRSQQLLQKHKIAFMAFEDRRARALIWKRQTADPMTIPLNQWASLKLGRRSRNIALFDSHYNELRSFFHVPLRIETQKIDFFSQQVNVTYEHSHSNLEILNSKKTNTVDVLKIFILLVFKLHLVVPNPLQISKHSISFFKSMTRSILNQSRQFWGVHIVRPFYNSKIYRTKMKFFEKTNLYWGLVVVRNWNKSKWGRYVVLGSESRVIWSNLPLLKQVMRGTRCITVLPLVSVYYFMKSKKWLLGYWWNQLVSKKWYFVLVYHKLRYFWGVHVVRPYYGSVLSQAYYRIKYFPLSAVILTLTKVSGLSKTYYFTKYQIEKRVLRRGL